MKSENLIFSREDKKIYKDGDRLVKVFDGTYSKANILNEALNHARVEETNLNVPQIQAVEVVDGQWAIILDYIEGETLQSLMNKHPEKEDEYLNLFVDLQMTVLSKNVPMLNKLKDKMNAQISAANLDATPYVIDWAHATQGNSSADVARSYLLFYLAGQEKLADKYLKLYCRKSDTAIQYVQRWIPIVAASRLVKSKPDEEEFLRKWIDVVDYE